MCGVPYHAADGYIARLVKKGHRVAICEQVEDPRKAKGVVKREVVRVVSPGTLADAGYLDAREPAFLLGGRRPRLDGREAAGCGSASRCWTSRPASSSVAEYTGRMRIRRSTTKWRCFARARSSCRRAIDVHASCPRRRGIAVTPVDGWHFDSDARGRRCCEQLRVSGPRRLRPRRPSGRGLRRPGRSCATCATRRRPISRTCARSACASRPDGLVDRSDHAARTSRSSRRRTGGARGSLLDEIDRTVTPMGGRLLRAWLLRPLVTLEPIRERLDAVEELAFRAADRGKVRETLKSVLDLERLVSQVALVDGQPARSRGAARSRWRRCPALRACSWASARRRSSRSLVAELDDLADVRQGIDATLADEPPALARDGGVVRDGVDAELDELRRISRSGKQVIAELEAAERARTGIQSLKVRFNRVFGYYIEISKSNLHAVPDDYHPQADDRRRRTLRHAGAEGVRGEGARRRRAHRSSASSSSFEALRARVAPKPARVLDTARAVAALDVLAGLAETAAIGNYTKPHVHDGDELVATDVRHPVVERLAGGTFVPNDVALDGTTQSAASMLTGPNMGGKSTYLRQVALLCAHGAGRLVRAGARREAGARRSHLRARRRVGQHRARPVDLHGRDAGDGAHPERRDVAEPRRARRDRPRHGDLRRPEHRLGGRRAPRDEPAGAAQDALRDALSRAHRSRRRACRAWSTRTSPRASGRTTSSSCTRSCPADPIAATASRWRGWPGCRRRSSPAPAKSSSRSNATSCRAAGGRRSAARQPDPAAAARAVPGARPPTTGCGKRPPIDVDRMTPMEALALLAELKKEI